jgi:hypothetical protein
MRPRDAAAAGRGYSADEQKSTVNNTTSFIRISCICIEEHRIKMFVPVAHGLRCTTSGAAGSGLGSTIKYLRGAAGIGLGAMAKYLQCTPKQRPEHHGQEPATHNERRRGQRPGHHYQVPATHNEQRRG